MISKVERPGQPREFYCLSIDTKPTEEDYRIGNADLLMEIDTGNVYLYDAEGKEWNQVV